MKFRRLTIVSLAVPIIAMAGLSYWVWWGVLNLPSTPISTTIQDRSGARIGEVLSTDWTRSIPVRLNQVPLIFVRGLISLEDRSFYEHFGVSPTGIARSGWNNFSKFAGGVTGPTQGGSTITMGLARNILWINRSRTLVHKIEEMLLALRIEWHMNKNQILEEYVNRIHFSRLSVWIGAASEAYLGKTIENLTDAESVALLSLIRNPTAYDPIAEPEAFSVRYGNVLRMLQEENVLSESERLRYIAEPISWIRQKDRLPYVTDVLKHRRDTSLQKDELSRINQVLLEGWALRTSIDLGLTNRLHSVAEEIRTWLQNRNVSDYGILVVDRTTLKLRVLIGGSDYQDLKSGQVNSIFAERQVGSTIKPFTYLLALTKMKMSMDDTILDAPVSFPTAEWNPYEPKNYSLRYRWNISLSEALAGSVNIPAVKLAAKVGVDSLLEFLRSLHITTLNRDAEHYGLALTLWVGEIPLWELLRAYTIFSEDGNLCEFSILEEWSERSCVEKADHRAVNAIVSTLSDARFKSEEFPLGSALDFWIGHVFVKTGTSRNFRDNYAIGFTKNYLIAVWTGNKDGSNMRWVSWASGAGEIFAGIVDALWERDFILNESNEISIQSTKNSPESKHSTDGKNRNNERNFGSGQDQEITITNPLPWSSYLLDPSVPKEKQNVVLKYWTKEPLDRVYVSLVKNTPPSNAPWESLWEPVFVREIGSDHRIPIGTLKAGTYTIRISGTTQSWSTLQSESMFQISEGGLEKLEE